MGRIKTNTTHESPSRTKSCRVRDRRISSMERYGRYGGLPPTHNNEKKPSKVRRIAKRCLETQHNLRERYFRDVSPDQSDFNERLRVREETWKKLRKLFTLGFDWGAIEGSGKGATPTPVRLPLDGKPITHPVTLYKRLKREEAARDNEDYDESDDESDEVINGIRVCSLKKAALIHGAGEPQRRKLAMMPDPVPRKKRRFRFRWCFWR